MASATGAFIAKIIGPLLKFNRIALINLRLIYPHWTAQEHNDVLKGVWDNLGRTIGEIVHIPRMNAKSFQKRVQIEGFENVEIWKKLNPQGIAFSAHMANWEVILSVSKNVNVPLTFIYRKPNDPIMDRIIFNIRSQQNPTLELIPKGLGGIKRLMRAIQQKRSIGMLVDQKMNEGIELPFMGHPAMTADSLGVLARRYNMPILPVQLIRLKGAYFKTVIHPPFMVEKTDDEEKDVREIMERVNAMIGDWVNQYPSQWLWIHRRWKHKYK